jgi:predicted small lipoprotein YifL
MTKFRFTIEVPASWLGICLLAMVTGCGKSGPVKYPVQGEVRFKNAPIDNGTMTLIPKSSSARTAVSSIVNGKYKTEVTAGDWTVNIRAVREKGKPDPKGGETPREQYIPAKFNSDSKVVVTVPSEKNEFNYDLDP